MLCNIQEVLCDCAPGRALCKQRGAHGAGEGEGFCDGARFPLAAGDVVVFPPRSTHGIDVAPSGRLYALVRHLKMLPNTQSSQRAWHASVLLLECTQMSGVT